MFTGIVEALGSIAEIDKQDDGARMVINTATLDIADMAIGDSLAVSGVCLSVLSKTIDSVSVDVSAETLRCTKLGELRTGSQVNLERALRLSDRLGGHLISGHVDGVGTVASREIEGESICLGIQAPAELGRYIATKGSVCVDGVSLTINSVEGAEFCVNLIPHTQTVTTLGSLERGSVVNIEVDLIARYLERLLGDRQRGQ